VRDAEEVGWPGPRRPAREPRDSRIWIHVAGAWRKGHVHRWVLDAGDPPEWLAWASYANPEGWAHPAWGLFRYDADVIRQREGDQPPDG
jgi:hypothetical protein